MPVNGVFLRSRSDTKQRTDRRFHYRYRYPEQHLPVPSVCSDGQEVPDPPVFLVPIVFLFSVPYVISAPFFISARPFCSADFFVTGTVLTVTFFPLFLRCLFSGYAIHCIKNGCLFIKCTICDLICHVIFLRCSIQRILQDFLCTYDQLF